MNCNCDRGVDDINGFILALTDAEAYTKAFPDCDRMLADVNNDQQVTVGDINAFVALLTDG